MPTVLRPTLISAPAAPPNQYDQRYMQELASAVRRLIQTSQNYPVLTASQIALANTSTSPDGLPIGTVYLKTLSSGETALDIVSSADPSTETAIAVIGGNGAPVSSLGLIGELYIDAQNKNLYGPKTLAGWGPAMPLGGGGSSATIAVGSTTTGNPGTSALVTNSGTSSAAVFNFTIPRGADGATGAAGSPGAPGAAATVAVGAVTTEAAGSPATVTNSGTSSAAVLDFGIPQGAQGIQGIQGPTGNTGATGSPGAAATVAVGTTTTGAAGSSASVTNSGSSSAAVLNFTVPQGSVGAPGSPGTAATVAVGTVSTGAPGSSATVTNSGTASAAVFNFSIPQGQPAPTTWTGSYNANGFILTGLGGLQLRNSQAIDFLESTNAFATQRVYSDGNGALTFDSAASSGAWANALRLSTAGGLSIARPDLLALGSNWQGWTPTVAASGSMTVSGISFLESAYVRVGPFYDFQLFARITLGGTASNQLQFSLPVAQYTASVPVAMTGYLYNGSIWSPCFCYTQGSTLYVEPAGEGVYPLVQISLMLSGKVRVV